MASQTSIENSSTTLTSFGPQMNDTNIPKLIKTDQLSKRGADYQIFVTTEMKESECIEQVPDQMFSAQPLLSKNEHSLKKASMPDTAQLRNAFLNPTQENKDRRMSKTSVKSGSTQETSDSDSFKNGNKFFKNNLIKTKNFLYSDTHPLFKKSLSNNTQEQQDDFYDSNEDSNSEFELNFSPAFSPPFEKPSLNQFIGKNMAPIPDDNSPDTTMKRTQDEMPFFGQLAYFKPAVLKPGPDEAGGQKEVNISINLSPLNLDKNTQLNGGSSQGKQQSVQCEPQLKETHLNDVFDQNVETGLCSFQSSAFVLAFIWSSCKKFVRAGLELSIAEHDKFSRFIEPSLIKIKEDSLNNKIRFSSFDYAKAKEINQNDQQPTVYTAPEELSAYLDPSAERKNLYGFGPGSKKAVFSLGCIAFQMQTGSVPFKDQDVLTRLNKIRNGQISNLENIQCEELKELFTNMLAFEAGTRLMMGKVIEKCEQVLQEIDFELLNTIKKENEVKVKAPTIPMFMQRAPAMQGSQPMNIVSQQPRIDISSSLFTPATIAENLRTQPFHIVNPGTLNQAPKNPLQNQQNLPLSMVKQTNIMEPVIDVQIDLGINKDDDQGDVSSDLEDASLPPPMTFGKSFGLMPQPMIWPADQENDDDLEDVQQADCFMAPDLRRNNGCQNNNDHAKMMMNINVNFEDSQKSSSSNSSNKDLMINVFNTDQFKYNNQMPQKMSGAQEFLEMTTSHEKTQNAEKIDNVSCSTGKFYNPVPESNLEDVDMSEEDDELSCDYNEDDYVYIEDEETYDNMTIEQQGLIYVPETALQKINNAGAEDEEMLEEDELLEDINDGFQPLQLQRRRGGRWRTFEVNYCLG